MGVLVCMGRGAGEEAKKGKVITYKYTEMMQYKAALLCSASGCRSRITGCEKRYSCLEY